MKHTHLRASTAYALIFFCSLLSSDALSQSRDIGAQRLLLDDGNGTGLAILEYDGPGDVTISFPPFPSTTTPLGTIHGQTLAWDHENGTWNAMSNVLNNGESLIVSGQLISLTESGAPFSILSNAVVPNLNSDLLDGLHATDFPLITRTISTVAPLTGGGDLSEDRTLALSFDATLANNEGNLGIDLDHANTWHATQTFTEPIEGNITGNAATSDVADLLANTSAAGESAIEALTTNGGTLTNNTSGLAANVSGIVAVAHGGTGVTTTSANYFFAGPDGSSGEPSFRALAIDDIPASSGFYIQNQSDAPQESANFNIDGDGMLGGTLSAAILALPRATDTTGYLTIEGDRFLLGSMSNLFFGALSGNTTLTSVGNLGIGTNALAAIASGENNIAIGTNTMTMLQEGELNIAIGNYVMEYSQFDARYNIAIGSYSMRGVADGTDNIAIGMLSMQNLSDGLNNVGIGNQALMNIGSSEDNTAIGNKALTEFEGGNRNTAIGSETVIGDNTTNTTVIGYGATALQSNQIVLGNSDVINVTTHGYIDTDEGYTVQGNAAYGEFLRGNGSRFVSSKIEVEDLPPASSVTPGFYGISVPDHGSLVLQVDSRGRVIQIFANQDVTSDRNGDKPTKHDGDDRLEHNEEVSLASLKESIELLMHENAQLKNDSEELLKSNARLIERLNALESIVKAHPDTRPINAR